MEEIIPTNWEENQSIIKVIGVGGGGGNAVNHMFRIGIKDVCFTVCNTDSQALKYSPVPEKLQLGELLTKGRGTGCDPELARKAAIESKEKIIKFLDAPTEMVFITAGMGGGTGTGAAPVIAEIAKQMGLLTVGVVTLPFHDEGIDFLKRALDGIQEIKKYADSLIVIDNAKMYKVYGDLSIKEAFAKADDVLSTAVKGIAEIITRHGYINIDFADVKMVMKDSGMALMGIGSGSGERRALHAVDMAFSSPLLNEVDLGSARNVLVNIVSGEENGINMAELSQIMDCIKEYTGGVSNFKRGVIYDPTMGESIQVTIVATGIDMNGLNTLPNPNKKTEEPIIVIPFPSDSKEPYTPLPRIILPKIDPPISKPVYATTPTPIKKDKPALILDPGENIVDYETIPAYIRQRAKIDSSHHPEIEISTLRIEEHDGKHHLNSNNSYIHQTQD